MVDQTHSPLGGFLDDLPKALYVLAHVVFLGVGITLWMYARQSALAHPSVLLPYVISQVVFFGFFGNWITLKMTVLIEQTLMLVMVCAVVMAAW